MLSCLTGSIQNTKTGQKARPGHRAIHLSLQSFNDKQKKKPCSTLCWNFDPLLPPPLYLLRFSNIHFTIWAEYNQCCSRCIICLPMFQTSASYFNFTKFVNALKSGLWLWHTGSMLSVIIKLSLETLTVLFRDQTLKKHHQFTEKKIQDEQVKKCNYYLLFYGILRDRLRLTLCYCAHLSDSH